MNRSEHIDEVAPEVVQTKTVILYDDHNARLTGCFSFHLQAYKAALESLGHSEYALKAGFHLNPKAVETALQVCYSLENAGKIQKCMYKMV